MTTGVHQVLPRYSCAAANAAGPDPLFALVGSPPSCERTVSREQTTTTTVTEHVPYTVQVRVAPFAETVHVPYTVQVRVAPFTVTEQVPYAARVRVAPFTERVRVAPFSETVTGTHAVTERYCASYDVVIGQSVCVRWATRTVTRAYSEVVEAYNYETRDVFNYEYVTRYRPETRTVTTTRTVTSTESAVPDAACTAGYTMNSASMCEHPAGVDLGDVSYGCEAGWAADPDDGTQCERTTTQTPGWDCPDAPAYTLDTSADPPHCHLDTGLCPPTALGALAAGARTLSGTWSASCRSGRIGSAQSPHWAMGWTFTIDADATVTASVSSAQNAAVYLIDTTAGAQPAARSYYAEVAAAAPRVGDGTSFALELTIAAAPGVTITGLTGDTRAPELGTTNATVASGFTVTPADATCTATPTGAEVTPADGADRTVSYDVPQDTTVNVEVTCRSGTRTAAADADFVAGWAPVQITGFDRTTEPAGDADSIEVSGEFDVIPADARCGATQPADATVTPATGGTRTVTVSLDAGEHEDVAVRCANGDAFDTAAATFAAYGVCEASLGTLAASPPPITGSLSADDGCTSAHRRADIGSRVYQARRHTFTLESPGWVTVTLESAQIYPDGPDPYLVLLGGHTPGAVTKISHNDDARNASGHGLHWRDSRITDEFLPAGDYTIEATTFHTHSTTRPQRTTGDYALTINAVLCTEGLGTLRAGRYARSGKISAAEGCVSSHRGTPASRPNDYLGKDLQLWLCRVGALFAPPQCAWVSVSADASTPGGSFASWIAAARD